MVRMGLNVTHCSLSHLLCQIMLIRLMFYYLVLLIKHIFIRILFIASLCILCTTHVIGIGIAVKIVESVLQRHILRQMS